MALANSLVGFLSGTVTYTNNEIGSFHCQVESSDLINTLLWSVDETDSKIATGEMYNVDWYYPLANLIAGVGLSTGFSWMSTVPANARVVSDVVIHLNWTFTLDDGTTCPISATYENGTTTYHTAVPPTLPSNIETMLADLDDMISKAVTACTFHP
ncbi:MAG: hypothetical protein M0R50_03280 [Candidatus Cloacimonetes bacterium]|jgi:hypothetical protein|nr:hypothetical protein [Candidatus Cloacimonadota bacterium]